MNEHLQALLERNQYCEEVKEQAVLRVLFGGEGPQDVCHALEIHSVYAINNWIAAYRKKTETGMITLSPITEKQKADLQAILQRNKELERALKDANLMIYALNTMIDVAEKNLKVPIRKNVVPNCRRTAEQLHCKDGCRSSLRTVW